MAFFSSQEEQGSIDVRSYTNSYEDGDALSRDVDGVAESNPRKRRKVGEHRIRQHQNQTHTSQIHWRSENQQTIYSSKLVQALRQVLRRNPTKPKTGRDVRDAADRVLAATAKGRTRWSRAILASPLGGTRVRMVNNHKKAKKATGYGLLKKERTRLSEKLRNRRVKDGSRRTSPAVHLLGKVRVLGKLVPGCRKVSLQNLLEEASDYIAALEMQVQAMKALSELLTGGTPADRVNPALV